MAISTIILGFEVSIAALLCLLCYQLVRQYRSFYKNAGASKFVVQANANQLGHASGSAQIEYHRQNITQALSADDSVSKLSSQPPVPIVSETPDQEFFSDNESLLNNHGIQVEEHDSKTILDDYIDGFFTDSSVVSAEQLDTFKADTAKSVDELNAQVNDLENAPPILQPIFVEELQPEEDDDSFIVVNDSVTDMHSGGEPVASEVMSDKVVHAMLKEAKTACS